MLLTEDERRLCEDLRQLREGRVIAEVRRGRLIKWLVAPAPLQRVARGENVPLTT